MTDSATVETPVEKSTRGGAKFHNKKYHPKSPTIRRSTYTTGQIAKICEVAPRTVSKWFDSGRLKGYRIPGSQDRRISHANFVEFLKKNNLPQLELIDTARTFNVLLLECSDSELELQTSAGLMSQEFTHKHRLDRVVELVATETARIDVKEAKNSFDFGFMVSSSVPNMVVLDGTLPQSAIQEALLFTKQVATEKMALIKAALLIYEDQDASYWLKHGFDFVYHRPAHKQELRDQVIYEALRVKQLLND